MNKRQRKKKINYEADCEEIWGYIMPYTEQRKMKRSYHETVVVQQDFRTVTDFSDMEELASILGISFEKQENKYRYPNRFRFKTFRKAEGNGSHKVVK